MLYVIQCILVTICDSNKHVVVSRRDLTDDVLNQFVHREPDVSIDTKDVPQLLLVHSCLCVAIQITPHHLQEARVEVHRLHGS